MNLFSTFLSESIEWRKKMHAKQQIITQRAHKQPFRHWTAAKHLFVVFCLRFSISIRIFFSRLCLTHLGIHFWIKEKYVRTNTQYSLVSLIIWSAFDTFSCLYWCVCFFSVLLFGSANTFSVLSETFLTTEFPFFWHVFFWCTLF